MNTELLIDAIVRQTTILVAQLATARGARTPLADIAEQVFADLVRELHRQGVSRKVAADMFGIALRTYRRKVQRLSESETVAGRSLWEAVHDFLNEREVANQAEVLTHFYADDQQIVRGVLQDLVESGLVFRAGRGGTSSYRVATRADLEHSRSEDRDSDSMDMLVWAVVYRLGPIERSHLATHFSLPAAELDEALFRLTASGRATSTETAGVKTYRAEAFTLPLGETHGWEAAVFDHFQAVVTTICRRLQDVPATPSLGDQIGGSTYTLEVWPEHPLEGEVLGELAAFRRRLGELRDRVVAHNRSSHVPSQRSKVVIYGGQCVTLHEDEDEDE